MTARNRVSTDAEVQAIVRFRENGGGVLTARDHQNLGCCLIGRDYNWDLDCGATTFVTEPEGQRSRRTLDPTGRCSP